MRPVILTIMLFLTSMDLCAQIDTTRKEFYPLHTGDLWQYKDESNNLAIQQVAGDTILDNEKYFLLIHSLRTSGSGIMRIDSLLRVQTRRGAPTGGDTCGGNTPYELSTYHLAEPDSSIWEICEYFWALPTSQPLARYNGITMMNIFGQPREVMHFDFGGPSHIPNDTIWGFGALLAKGIGIIQEQYYDGAYYVLQGAIIDSVQYGTIVSVEKTPKPIPVSAMLYQNYPNPFNPKTTIRYEIPRGGRASLKVFNLLGQEIAVLADNYHQPGSYQATFDASHLSSGFYIYRLHAGGAVLTRRMLFIK